MKIPNIRYIDYTETWTYIDSSLQKFQFKTMAKIPNTP